MAKVNQDIKTYSGEYKQANFTVTGFDDLDDVNVEWTAGRTTDSTVLISKTTLDVEIVGLTITVTINPADTTNLYGIYKHQLKIIDGGGNPDVVAEGMLRVLPAF